MTDAANPASGRFAAFSYGAFATFWWARLLTTFGAQILSIAVLWEIWALTRNTWYNGLVGLVQFVPLFLLVLVTGTAADRFGRRLIMGASIVLLAACAGGMLAMSLSLPFFHPVTGPGSPDAMLAAHMMLAIMVVFGVGRAFLGPASSSLVVSLEEEAGPGPAVSPSRSLSVLTNPLWFSEARASPSQKVSGPRSVGSLTSICRSDSRWKKW